MLLLVEVEFVDVLILALVVEVKEVVVLAF